MSQSPTPNKPLPTVPRPATSTLFLSRVAEDEKDVTFLPSAEPLDRLSVTATSDTSKRDYALLELLDSERTYASDLILIRDFQIPLASGRLSSISRIWPTSDSGTTIRRYPGLAASDTHTIPPRSSTAVSRPLTTASEASAMSLDSIFTLRPMKTKDINVVFGNVEELATFSEIFLDQLESALGDLIEGNEGEDYVGRFFLDFIPQMEPLYRTYIMNQSHALEHYHRLSKTFQFDVYFPRSQILAHKSSNAWDLPSLLIKPVQRLLHYPSLLATIIATTPDSHGDKANLIAAHAQMEELARCLNARWRQQKAVRDVLAEAGLSSAPRESHDAAKPGKKGALEVGLGLAVSMSLGRIIKLRSVTAKTKEGPEVSVESDAVKAMGERLRSYGPFMLRLAKEMLAWADTMRDLVGALKEWGESFSRMVWMDNRGARVKALKGFSDLLGGRWLWACHKLKADIEKDVLRAMDALQHTMAAPMRLLEAVQTLESSSPSFNLAASESYVAIRAQLFAELPRYLTLLDRGVAARILGFAHIQRRFYRESRDMWSVLSFNFGNQRAPYQINSTTKTLRVWSLRFRVAEAQVSRLGIVQRFGEGPPAAKPWTETGDERHADEGLQGASSVPLPSILTAVQQSKYRSRATRRRAVPSYYPAANDIQPRAHPTETDSEGRSGEEVLADHWVTRLQPHVPCNDRPLIRLSVVEEDSASDLDDLHWAGTLAIPNQDAGTILPQKPTFRPNDPPADVSEPMSTTISAFAKREAAANAKFGTRLVNHHPSRAPSDSASRRKPYAREASASAKFGTRLVHPPSLGSSALYLARPQMANTAHESSANAKFGTRLISDSHPAFRLESRRIPATPGFSSAMGPYERTPSLAHHDSNNVSDAESEESGVGFYRDICKSDR